MENMYESSALLNHPLCTTGVDTIYKIQTKYTLSMTLSRKTTSCKHYLRGWEYLYFHHGIFLRQ